jgi:hypothetical protein
MNIQCRVNTFSKKITYITPESDIRLIEYENKATTITFNFDKMINENEKLVIIFSNNKESIPYQLTRLSSNKYMVEIHREILARGRMYYIIQHYNQDASIMAKYAPEGYLYVNAGLDVSVETLERHPDLIADMIFRIQKLENEIELLKNERPVG